MSSISELHILADELTVVLPPPTNPKGANIPPPAVGKWVAVHIGAGNYAIRAQYEGPTGETQVYASADEMRGYPSTLVTALKFTIGMLNAHRHQWMRV